MYQVTVRPRGRLLNAVPEPCVSVVNVCEWALPALDVNEWVWLADWTPVVMVCVCDPVETDEAVTPVVLELIVRAEEPAPNAGPKPPAAKSAALCVAAVPV